MDLIRVYLKAQNPAHTDTDDDSVLNAFYNRFIDVNSKLNESQRQIGQINQKHQNELNELEKYIQMVKNFTEEREQITLEYKEENTKLKNKIKLLQQNTMNTEDELSEGTIEMLVEEGFGHIVSVPNHERIAVLLSERARLIAELDSYKSHRNNSSTDEDADYDTRSLKSNSNNELDVESMEALKKSRLGSKKIGNDTEDLENEIETLKTANRKLSKEIELYKQQQSSSGDEAMDKLKIEIESLEIKCKKYDEDNFNLKLELDKLYEEIDTYDKEISNLKMENLRLKDDYENVLDEMDYLKSMKSNEILEKQKTRNGESAELIGVSTDSNSNISSSNVSVRTVERLDLDDRRKSEPASIKHVGLKSSMSKSDVVVANESVDELQIENERLKQEIDVLNNELDELLLYKSRYERLNIDYEKLKQKSVDNITAATVASSSSSLLDLSQKRIGGSQQHLSMNAKGTAQMELDWIKRENEKILLENEQLQMKLSDSKTNIEQLKLELKQNDERMKNFIEIIDKSQYKPEELITLQKEIQRLNENLNLNNENFDKTKEDYELKIQESNQVNENLWNKLKLYEENLQEQLDLVKLKEFENENLQTDKSVLIHQLNELSVSFNELRSEIDDVKKDNNSYEERIRKLNENIVELNESLKQSQQEILSLINDKNNLMVDNERNRKHLNDELKDVHQKHQALNDQYTKAAKENSDMIAILKEKDQFIRKLEMDVSKMSQKMANESREKLDVLDKLKNHEQTIDMTWQNMDTLKEKLKSLENEKVKLEYKVKDFTLMEEHNKQLNVELKEKRETIGRHTESHSKLEYRVYDLERQLKDAHQQHASHTDQLAGEISSLKSNILIKNDDYIKYKQEFENEKAIREKLQEKLDDIRDEFKKMKLKLKALENENNDLQKELIETKNQVKYGQYNKNSDSESKSETKDQQTIEIRELRKNLEIFDMRCTTYAHKFEHLSKKYANKKLKYKTKTQRLLDCMQREKNRYKELLFNAQSELNKIKNNLDKETEFKIKSESTIQNIIEEKRNLLVSIIEKDSKMREMKRENTILNSKIKTLEEEMESINDKINSTLKERNKLRKEIFTNAHPMSEPTSRTISPTMTSSLSPLNYGNIGIDTMNNFIESKINSKLWATSSSTQNNFFNNWDKYKLLDAPQVRRPTNTSRSNTNIATITNAFDSTLNTFLGMQTSNTCSNTSQQKTTR